MDSGKLKCIRLAGLVAMAAFFFSSSAGAQQITYYSFDNALNTGGAGVCTLPNTTDNPLLCLNHEITPDYNGTGQNTFPNFTYPYYLIPNATEDSVHSELLMNESRTGNGESVWFSRAQKVKNGFTSYFAFEVDPNSEVGTADGFAFVVQNAQGSLTSESASGCSESGSGVTALGTNGGCLSYGGIDNSVAIEFDTFLNSYDTTNNHIAVQSCGTAQNTSSHASPASCTIAINNTLPFTIADGYIHEVVVEYTGDPSHLLQVYVDPEFVPGTHTPCTAEDECDGVATPVISVNFDIGSNLNLLSSADGQDSAYVGFTAATGGSAETNQMLDWTYTPHSTSTESQPINNDGAQTTFPFGEHTYGVTYPSGDAGTSTDMIVDANTISPLDFATLIAGTPFNGSVCQVYEGTGGNCIIYSVHCVTDGTTTKVPCPATSDPSIAVKTAYESTASGMPPSPGFLQGDPLYSQIATIKRSGDTATVTCTGECAVSDGETVSIRNNSEPTFNAENVTASVPNPSVVDSFTYTTSSASNATGNGGFVTSGNVQNICNGPDDAVPCWQPQRVDPTTSGKTKNFSDLVSLYETVSGVATTTSISAPTITYGDTAEITVSVSPNTGPGPVTGSVTLTVDGTPLAPQTLSGGTTTFSVPGLSAGGHPLSASYGANSGFLGSGGTGTQMVNKANPVITWTPASIQLGYQLGAAQLNASANVEGGFVYTPPAGTTVNTTPTFPVAATFTPMDTMNYNTVYPSVLITVTAGPLANISPPSIDFGTVYVLSITTKTVTITNAGNAPMTITGPFISIVKGGNSKEFVSVNLCPKSLAAGKQCTMTVSFVAGPVYTPRTAILSINDNAPGNPHTIPLTATVINPQAALSTSSLNFGNQKFNTTSAPKTVTLKNTGATTLHISNIGVAGGNAGDFSVLPTSTCGSSLNAGSSCSINITFKPSAKASRSSTLTISDDARTSTQKVALSGKGT